MNMQSPSAIPVNSALLIVDLQVDFIRGGTLAVPGGEQIIPVVERLVHLPFNFKLASKDWHPLQHVSFATTHQQEPGSYISLKNEVQQLWPVHCIQNTKGAEFAPGWDYKQIDHIFYKGMDPHIDSYSAFFDNQHTKSTGLGDFLEAHKIKHLFIAGLTTDYCVKYSALDAMKFGFQTYVISDACRGVNVHPGDTAKAYQVIQQTGVKIITSGELITLI